MKFLKANTGNPPLEKILHIRDSEGMCRLGNFFDNDGIVMLGINATATYTYFVVAPKDFDKYEWLDTTEPEIQITTRDGKEIKYVGEITHIVNTKFDWKDRLRILFHGKMMSVSSIYTMEQCTISGDRCSVFIDKIFRRKFKGGQLMSMNDQQQKRTS